MSATVGLDLSGHVRAARADQCARPSGVQSVSATRPRPVSRMRASGRATFTIPTAVRFASSCACPKPVRLWWGGLKNLLSGVTTVCHHNPYEREVFNADFPVRVVRRFAWAHSLEFEPDLAARFRKAPASYPFLVHCARGRRCRGPPRGARTGRLGALDERTAIVHGVGITGRRSRSDATPRRVAGLVPHFQPGDARPHRLARRAALRHPDGAGHRFGAERSGRSAGRTHGGAEISACGAALRNGHQRAGAHSPSVAKQRRLDRGPLGSPNARSRRCWRERSRWWWWRAAYD